MSDDGRGLTIYYRALIRHQDGSTTLHMESSHGEAALVQRDASGRLLMVAGDWAPIAHFGLHPEEEHDRR